MDQVEKHALQEQVVQWLREGRTEPALKACLDMLNDDHDEPSALFQFSKMMIDQRNKGLAYNLMARATKLRPDIPEMWLQFAQCHGDTPEEWEKSVWCIRKSIKTGEKAGKSMLQAWATLGAIEYLRGNYPEAEKHLQHVLDQNPDMEHAASTMSFVRLANRQWEKAWELYDVMLKNGQRENYGYGDTVQWDGTPGKRLVISAEQGIGDEIMYASCIQEGIDVSESVVIECMPRLERLFKRSFPQAAAVYGTRWDREVVWGEDHNPEVHCAMATLPRFFRHKDEDFHGSAYLTPNDDITAAIRGMLSELGPNPKVGIAWTGGSERTRGHLRTRTLEELTPVLRIPGIDWISLEYHNKEQEIGEYYQRRNIPIHVYRWITDKGLDYDLTAGLINELDLVISVPTTAVQMAGALGVECWVIVPKYTGWMFANETYPWANSVHPLRNPPIKDLESRMQAWVENRKTLAA